MISTEVKEERVCKRCGEHFTTRRKTFVCSPCITAAYKLRNSPEAVNAERERRQRPGMTLEELHKALEEGRRWFHNGGKRWRHVTGYTGGFVYYTKGNTVTGELTGIFLQWAKGGAHAERTTS